MKQYINKEEVLKNVHELYSTLKEIQETGGTPYSIVLSPVLQDMIALMSDIDEMKTIDF